MILTIAYVFQMLSLPLLIFRLVKGPNWSDRIITADLLIVYLASGLLVLKNQNGWLWDRDVIWLALILGLASVIAASLLMEDKRDR